MSPVSTAIVCATLLPMANQPNFTSGSSNLDEYILPAKAAKALPPAVFTLLLETADGRTTLIHHIGTAIYYIVPTKVAKALPPADFALLSETADDEVVKEEAGVRGAGPPAPETPGCCTGSGCWPG